MIDATTQAVKKVIKSIPVLVERALSTSLEGYNNTSCCEEMIADHEHAIDGIQAQEELSEQLDWKRAPPVTRSGVYVLSGGILLMCRPLEVHQRHSASRKAIVCTRHCRPLKYPGAQPLWSSFAFIRRNLRYWMKNKGKGHFSGNVALLGNSVFDNANYYHFWTDVIADIWYIRQHLPEADLPGHYLVPFSNATWQWDILTLCGVNESQVIPYDRHDIFSLDRLVIPVRDKGAMNLPSWLSRAIHDMSEWTPRVHRGERLIFVSRADADRRRVANEAVLRERLREKGFEVHTLNGLSVWEQQHLFASAAIICAPHGAALTNLVWCGPGTVIIDLLSERHLVPCFRELARQNRLIYYPYACKQAKGVNSGIKGDIIVTDAQIESMLDIIARHVPRSDHVMAS